MGRTRRAFTQEFKRETVKLVTESGHPTAQARQDIFEWIEVFYNRTRRHSTLGYRSPAEFEAMAMGS